MLNRRLYDSESIVELSLHVREVCVESSYVQFRVQCSVESSCERSVC